MKLSHGIPAIALLILLTSSGCCEEDEGLTVRGSVSVAIEDADTGFSFAGDTRLVDDGVDQAGDSMAGHCIIDPAGPGQGAVEVAIVRPQTGTEDAGSRTIRSFHATFVDAVGEVEGEVEAQLGEVAFRGEGTAGCELVIIYTNMDTGQAGLEATCDLVSDDGEAAQLEAELHFRACQVIEPNE
jgi:hypothetical protein